MDRETVGIPGRAIINAYKHMEKQCADAYDHDFLSVPHATCLSVPDDRLGITRTQHASHLKSSGELAI